jgi:hypothetical protein
VYLNDQLIDLAMKLIVSQLPEALRVRMHPDRSVYSCMRATQSVAGSLPRFWLLLLEEAERAAAGRPRR